MELTRIPLPIRLAVARSDQVCQPEYFPCLIQEWAKMPIRTYFSTCTEELQQLYFALGLASEENPSYQAVAEMVNDEMALFGGLNTEALGLLAAPVRALDNLQKKKRGGGGSETGQ